LLNNVKHLEIAIWKCRVFCLVMISTENPSVWTIHIYQSPKGILWSSSFI